MFNVTRSFKNAVSGCIVKTSIVCIKYTSCAAEKYPFGVWKSQSIKTTVWLFTSVSSIDCTFSIPTSSFGKEVYTAKLLLTLIPLAIPFAKLVILDIAVLLNSSSFLV